MAEIEFRLLGQLEVWRSGEQLAVGGPKPRALLAVLLLHAGEAVGSDRLVEALWGEHPPANSLNALQAHVAVLRRALHASSAPRDRNALLVTRAPGYMLRVAPDELDVARFERLVADGRELLADDPVTAAGLLREALSLWRGPALADFVYEQFACGEAARLEELRLTALEWRFDADLALGRHAEAVPELEALVAEHPLREGLAGQLMVALYRTGRQADASRVYHATRVRLVEELGMEPGPPLRELHDRVLDQDPALGLGAPAPDLASPHRGGERASPTGHNLPAELTSFIGRERELGEISAALRESRLLTLTGAGGSGKTRLALRVARQVIDEFPDGAWLIELASLADPNLVAKTIATALGVREDSGPVLDALTHRLRKARLLVVLDNCEHLVDACALATHCVLTACEGVRFLATSREPLRVAGEATWPVPGLELPTTAAPAEELGGYAAVRLFEQRARAIQPGFVLGAGNAETLTQLCQRLDGMPLAIELAAARVRVLSPQEILLRLDHRFALLTEGTRGAVARQQTLRATVDWSHDLLTLPERALFRRLSVFAGGWRATHAERVCADEQLSAATIFELLCQLVAKSLVTSEPTAGGTSRYRLLETLREYAHEQLTGAGELDAVRRRHFIYFLRLAESARAEQLSTGSDAGLAMLASEQDNLRAALTFARAADKRGLLRLATAMEPFWLAGNVGEGRRWLGEAIALDPEWTVDHARALLTAGTLASIQQAHDKARKFVTEALVLSASVNDEVGEAWSHLTLGMIEWIADNPSEATGHLRRSLAMHKKLDHQLGASRSRILLAASMILTPRTLERGRIELKVAAQIAHDLEDRWGEGLAMMILGLADLDAGQPDIAADHLRRALLSEAIGPIRGGALEGFAQLAGDDDPPRALRLLGAATRLRERQTGRPPEFLKRRAAAIRARAEEQLELPDAEQAWNEGYQMTTPHAIAHALDNRQANEALQPHQSATASAN
ncbi:MAG: winged helix-turn-helix domain-containing protein [Solirubrobacterales bacterium]|nr:winged helix-turn-helix domain-containing protein [Solirubrobacterales bacterium]